MRIPQLAVLAVLAVFLASPAAGLQVGNVAQEAYLKSSTAPDPPFGDEFGWRVAASGGTLVVGARYDDSSATGVNGDGSGSGAPASGAAYVFRRAGTGWYQEAYLKASNTEASDYFGTSVAISGDTIVVGAIGEDSSASGVNGIQADNNADASGAAYVFVWTGTTWAQEAYLKASNTDPFDEFGMAVAVSGDIAVVGAWYESSPATGVNGNQGNGSQLSGAAYVFVRNGTDWSQEAYLKASNSNTTFRFGEAVAVSGNTVVAGAKYEPFGGPSPVTMPDVGAAYVFVRNGTTWSQEAYLKASNNGFSDFFGNSVAIDGDTIAVGAFGESGFSTGVNGPDNDFSTTSGAAYVFQRTGTQWNEQAYLKASNTGSFDQFGSSVSVAGDVVVVGALGEDSAATGIDGDQADNSASTAGAAYVFSRSGTTWTPGPYIKASNTDPSDTFGTVALAGDTLVVGARRESSAATGVDGDQTDNSAAFAGAAYVYDLGGWPDVYCSAKTSSAGCTATIATSDTTAQPVSGATDYSVTATRIQGLKNGLLFAGVGGSAQIPFNGGTLCVQPPLKRGPVLFSGGTNPNNCSGAYATLVNDGTIVPAGLDAGPGSSGWYQYWYRDPADPFGVALSDAVQLDFQ